MADAEAFYLKFPLALNGPGVQDLKLGQAKKATVPPNSASKTQSQRMCYQAQFWELRLKGQQYPKGNDGLD
jgi:hypothetical protein